METTALEYREFVRGFRESIGPRAEVYTSFNEAGKIFHATLYSRGIAGIGGSDFVVQGDTWSELRAGLSDKWAEYSERHRAEVTRKMALAIIRITADLGECTDAALRNCGEFDPGQINAYGEQACADANDIAGRGPFSIVVMGGANAEEEAA